MKKLITILISCSLALAAGAMAQQEEAQPTPKKKQKQQQQNAHAPREGQPPANPEAERPANRPHAGMKAKEPGAANPRPHAKTEVPANEPVNATANPDANAPAEHHKKERNAPKAPATANETAKPAPTEAKPQAEAAAPASPQANKPHPGAQELNAEAKKPDVQAIKAQHANFHAQPKPEQVPAVTFSQSRQITGSEHWQGEKYAAFRSYHPQMHDQRWYHSHYNRIELIGGGYYYWNGGYWYPAWGYNPTVSYYVYDGPIYVGARAEPPDRVIAEVQASLQTQGYYKGEVDGLLGPLTREALTGYQSDHGLYTTAAIDEPTLASLGLG
jgi:hypothetical protein